MKSSLGQYQNFPLLKRRAKYPKKKKYGEYRQEIREDCKFRCVYCDVHEDEIGGQSVMTLDHFRPHSFPQYIKLKHDPYNLMWSCFQCNQNKGDKWPAYGMSGTVAGKEGFVDPFQVNRLDYFDLTTGGALIPKKDPANYMIHVLDLNRSFLNTLRKARVEIIKTLSSFLSYIDDKKLKLQNQLESKDIAHAEVLDIQRELAELEEHEKKIFELHNSLIKK